MASISKRGQYWRAHVRRKGLTPISKTFDLKSDAEKWSRDVENQIDRGIFRNLAEAERTTLHDALDRYDREIGAKKRHPLQEHQRIQQWQRHGLSKRFLATLRGTDFAKYRDDRRTQGRAENTIRLELQIISHLFEIARKEWGLEGLPNPLKDIRKPSGSNERDRRLLPGEFETLLAELQESGNAWAAPAFELSIETSLRQGMLFKIERSWLDRSGRVFHIPATHRGAGNKVVPAYLPLSARATEIVAGLPESSSGRLLDCTQNAVVMAWKRAVISARNRYESDCMAKKIKPQDGYLQKLRWHDLRHEAASRLFEKGLNPMEVASIGCVQVTCHLLHDCRPPTLLTLPLQQPAPNIPIQGQHFAIDRKHRPHLC